MLHVSEETFQQQGLKTSWDGDGLMQQQKKKTNKTGLRSRITTQLCQAGGVRGLGDSW